MHISQNTHGEFFLVFDSEIDVYEFQANNPDFVGFPLSCYGGYMNALQISEGIR